MDNQNQPQNPPLTQFYKDPWFWATVILLLGIMTIIIIMLVTRCPRITREITTAVGDI